MEQVNFNCRSYTEWKNIMAEKLKTATNFEIHCWEDEKQWIALALNYGTEKKTDWSGK